MVQAIENLTRIGGTIVARLRNPTLAGSDVVTVDVDRTGPVPGKADLIGQLRGTRVEVSVRRELLGQAGTGTRLRCRAKRTPDGAMCEKEPGPGEFGLE
jgi:hypothetical protein